MAGVITLKLSVMKSGIKHLDMKSPLFLPGPVEPHYGPSRYLTFEGFSVDEKGVQHYMDATVAYRQATLRCIEYLRRYGEFFFCFFFVFCLFFVFYISYPHTCISRPLRAYTHRTRFNIHMKKANKKTNRSQSQIEIKRPPAENHVPSSPLIVSLGYSDYQVYLLLSCAPIQGHVGGLVDIPNACMTLGLPMDIFDFDISPVTTITAATATKGGGGAVVERMDMGACAVASK